MNNLIIKPAEQSDLPILESSFIQDFQKARLGIQKSGDGIYLIAWLNNQPVGHLLIRFSTENHYLKEHGIKLPYIEAVEIKKDYQNQGIATKLMEEAEKILKEEGFPEVGLAVGLDNDPAQKLYEHLGYTQYPNLDHFTVSWEVLGDDGLMIPDQEECIYLIKKLS